VSFLIREYAPILTLTFNRCSTPSPEVGVSIHSCLLALFMGPAPPFAPFLYVNVRALPSPLHSASALELQIYYLSPPLPTLITSTHTVSPRVLLMCRVTSLPSRLSNSPGECQPQSFPYALIFKGIRYFCSHRELSIQRPCGIRSILPLNLTVLFHRRIPPTMWSQCAPF